MPICKKCGYENKEGNNYCVNCGAIIELTETEAKRLKEKERKTTYMWAVYFLIFFGMSTLFGGLWTYLTSIGTIIESISFSVSFPYILFGLILLLIGLAVLYFNISEV